MFNDFVHLHCHSEFSLLDGYSSIAKYVEALQKLGQSGMAITDHGNMHGVIEFYRQMRKANLKPILGEEFYVCAWDTNIQHRVRDFDHMVLLAQTQQGYQNMMKLSSIANTLGFYYKGRIDFDLLAAHNEGIIATSGCAAAPIFSSLLEGKLELADKITKWMKEVFGKRFYIELQWHPGLPEHNIHIKELIELGRKYEVKTIITNDSHYAFEKDAPIQDLLLCLQMNKRVNDPDRMKFSDGEYYAKSATELRQNLQGYLEDSEIDRIFKTTCEIAESCECNPEGDTKPKIPYVETYNVNIDEFLADLAKKKMDEMFGGAANLQYQQRLNEELDVIKKTKFAAYFLIIDDICKFSQSAGISWNTRGSAAGSLVFYVLGVSFVDPIKNNLLFSRFLNEYRISIPDCDLDFPDSRRKEIIQYIVQKYGEDYTAQIVTFGRMKARMAVRDVGRALGIWKDDVDLIAKSIKNTPGKPITIANSLDPESEYYSADFLAHYNKTKNAKTIIDYALSLETTTRHTGVHAAAVLISDKPLVDYVPLQRGGNSATTNHIAQIDYPTCESIGLLKVDCLGLSTLTIIDLACELINSRHNTKLSYMNVPYEDSSSYDLLCAANCIGVFQVENQGLRKALAQLQPRTFTQVADMISLYRPGPIGYIPEYIEQTHHPKHIEYRHQLLEDIIGPTAGIMVYQEQVNQVLIKLAGYAPGEADLVRKSISKKDVAKIDKNRKVFIEGCAKNGIDKKTAELIHDDIEKFALYGFNRAHAASYARITLITAWLKANYPIEYLTACLQVEGTDEVKRAKYVNDAKRNGIAILPPKLGNASENFYIDGTSIRFGFSNIKGVGDKASVKLAKVKTVADISKLKLNQAVIEALVAAGTFDDIVVRKFALNNILELTQYLATYNKVENTGQRAFTYPDIVYNNKTPAPVARFEKEHLGVWLENHPLDKNRRQYDNMELDTSIDIPSYDDNEAVRMMGAVQDVREVLTKKGDKMAFVILSDYNGFANVVVFPKVYKEIEGGIQPNQVLYLTGKVQHGEEDSTVLVQNIKIMKDWQ